MAELYYSVYVCVCVCGWVGVTFSLYIHPWMNSSGCFHVLIIVNNAAVSMGVYAVFFGLYDTHHT